MRRKMQMLLFTVLAVAVSVTAHAVVEKRTLATFNSYVARVNEHLNRLKDIMEEISGIEAELATTHRKHFELFESFINARSNYRNSQTEKSRQALLQAIGFLHRADPEFIANWQRNVERREDRIRLAYGVLKAAVHDIYAVELMARYINKKETASVRQREAERLGIRKTIKNLAVLLHSIDMRSTDEKRIRMTMKVLYEHSEPKQGASVDLAETVGLTCNAFEDAYDKIREAKAWASQEKKFMNIVWVMVTRKPRRS